MIKKLGGKRKSAKLALELEPWKVPVAHAKWVQKAVSKDHSRRSVMKAALVHHDGAAWIAGTNTHRIHMLRLGECEPFERRTIDLEWLLLQAKFHRADALRISRDFSHIQIEVNEHVIPAAGDCFPDCGYVIDYSRAIPKDATRPVTEIYAINYKYLVDACSIANAEANRVFMFTEGEIKPIVFRGNTKDWLAVVMPMCSKGFVE